MAVSRRSSTELPSACLLSYRKGNAGAKKILGPPPPAPRAGRARPGRKKQGMRSTRGFAVAVLAGCALLAAGCSSSSPGQGSAASSQAPSSPAAASASATSTSVPNGLRTVSTSIGTVLATSSGRTVYELAGATPAHSACTGTCLSIWPPVEVNGHQVVVNGHPAYRFSGDTAQGQTNGEGLKDTWGKWWALSPAGNPITTHATPTPTSSGYGDGY